MSKPDLSVIPGIALEGEVPVFQEPWEAQAFAPAVRLHENGVFSWSEWADMLGAEIRADSGSTPYYQLWFQALEKMTSKKLQITREETVRCKSEWQAALLATPHGEPVELRNGNVIARPLMGIGITELPARHILMASSAFIPWILAVAVTEQMSA